MLTKQPATRKQLPTQSPAALFFNYFPGQAQRKRMVKPPLDARLFNVFCGPCLPGRPSPQGESVAAVPQVHSEPILTSEQLQQYAAAAISRE